MKDTLDNELNDSQSQQVKDLQQTYIWLAIVIALHAFISLIYFAVNIYGRNNFWVYDFYPILNIIILIIKFPVLIVAIVKVKRIFARVVLIATLTIAFIHALEDIWNFLT